MKKNIVIAILFISLFIPSFVQAKEYDDLISEDVILIAEDVKYYKTISYVNSDIDSSHSVEISEKEYNNVTENKGMTYSNDGYTETNYKKMTTSVYQNGSNYRYKVILNWKTMPSTRSYDILAIAINPSVKITSSIYFNQSYCFSGGGCTNNGTFYEKKTATGAGAFFKLPTGSLTSLSSILYFDVAKNTTATIIKQDAYGDYSHATKNVSSSESQSYNVSSLGINLNSSIYNSYDSISVSHAIWNGNW